MNRDQKRALYSLLIWSVVIVIFIPLFFINGGADTWVPGSIRVIVTSSFIIAGFILFFLMLALTKRKRLSGVERDERDILIGRRASEITLTIVVVYVFLTCIILYFVYGEINTIPRGWLWFLGCTCLFISYISSSASSLILYSLKVRSDE
jgi:uncharacterized membrane protein